MTDRDGRSPKRPLRVLLVEDSEDDAILLLRELENRGFDAEHRRVESAVSLSEALSELDWDVVLADYELPGFDAPRALAIVQEAAPETPFIVVTGAIGEQRAVDLMRAGAHDFLLKDNLARLGPAIERELEEARKRREHDRALEALERSEERFRELAEHIDEVFWINVPGGGRLQYVSPAFEEIWGRPRREILGAPERWIETIHPDDRERVEAAIAHPDPGQYDEEYRIVRPDGDVRWIWDRAFPILGPDGEVRRIVGVAEDVTERKRVHEALAATERYFRSLIENSADVIFVILPEGTITFASPSAEPLLGLEPDDLVGRDILDFLHPEDRSRIRTFLASVAFSDDRKARASFRVKGRDDQIRYVECTASDLLEEPEVGGIVVNARDITEETELQKQLHHSQKLEAVGRLAGGVAHDFNNLLTVVRGHAELLLGDLDEASPLREETREILRAADRAAQLTRQLLAFGQRHMQKLQAVDLNDAVEEVSNMLTRIIGEDIVLELDLSAEPMRVRVDPTQIHQVILNLAVNARDAMPRGGRLILRTRRVPGREEISGNADLEAEWHCVLEVEDTGTGIPPEIRDHVFEPFFSGKEQGSGLGLSTVYGIVDQSGGAISLDTEVGRGTRFEIYLPEILAEDPATPAAGANPGILPTAGPDGGRSPVIVLVEDDPALRPLMERILRRAGYALVSAPSLDEARTALQNHDGPIDLLVVELALLEEQEGTDAVERLRASHPDMGIILLAHYPKPLGKGISPPSGARSRILKKPFNSQALLDAAAAALLERAGSDRETSI